MGRRILRHTYRSRALAFVVNVARGERSEEDVLEEVEMLRQDGAPSEFADDPQRFHLDSLFYRLRARYDDDIPVVGTTLRQLVYPDMLEPRYRLGADPILRYPPKVLHGPYTGPIPSLGEYQQPPPLAPAAIVGSQPKKLEP
eukprot:s2511_g7.t1